MAVGVPMVGVGVLMVVGFSAVAAPGEETMYINVVEALALESSGAADDRTR